MGLVRPPRTVRVIPFLIAVCFVSLPVQAQYGGGSGEPNDPYLIYTAEQMNEIGLHEEDWDSHFKLMADIDLEAYTGTDFNVIGILWDNPFTGVFDGNGKKILNFNYTYTSSDKGLFGYVSGETVQIKDLGLIDPNVAPDPNFYGGMRVGSLVGCLYDATVANCHVEDANISASWFVGGLVGYNSGTIVKCRSSGSFQGGYVVGGLVGDNHGRISECNSSGELVGHWYPGGLVGSNSGVVSTCY